MTSPPYYRLRDYGMDGQIGLENTVEEYIERLVDVFDAVRRVLKKDGNLYINIGDSYAGSEKSVKRKNLIGIPWRLAFALQESGWYLREDIIWAKPNPMPESVRDRCTRSHEYIFHFTKSSKYYYDAEAISEPSAESTAKRIAQDVEHQTGSARAIGKTNGNMKACAPRYGSKRNKRDVWTVTTKPCKEAHFATFPLDLIEPCILAGSPCGGIVLDPFSGSGTVGVAAVQNGREYVLIELNPDYIEIARKRLVKAQIKF